MTAAPAAWAPALASAALIVAKSTLLLGAAAGGARLLRRGSAAARHLVWTLGLGGLLALPALAILLPDWKPELLAFLRPAAAAASETGGDVVMSGSAIHPVVLLFLAVWAAGTIVVLARLAIGLRGVARLARGAEPVTDPAWTDLLERFGAAVGVRRPVVLLRSRDAAMPLTWGAFRPAVLLPAEADGWGPERRRVVLLHELAHVARRDCLMQLLAEICCALYWFHPGAWWAARKMRIEREQACDDLVLAAGARASEYAGHLLDVARTYRAPALAAAIAMARPSHLEGRVRAVLEATRDRRAVTRRTAAVCAGAVLLASLPLAAVAPSERAQAPSPSAETRVIAWKMPEARSWNVRPGESWVTERQPSIHGTYQVFPAQRVSDAPRTSAPRRNAHAAAHPSGHTSAAARTPRTEPRREEPVRLASNDGAVVATVDGSEVHARIRVGNGVEVRFEGHGVRAVTSRGQLRIDADLKALASALAPADTSCPKSRATRNSLQRKTENARRVAMRRQQKTDLGLRILGAVSEIAAAHDGENADDTGGA
ncbi:MAG TPA: M56 family metallopeptidase [Longimicrobium sp.]